MIIEAYLVAHWVIAMKPTAHSKLICATNQPVKISGTIVPYLRIGEARVRGVFGVVWNLVVPLILRTSFINRFVKGIFPQELEIVPFNSHSVSICIVGRSGRSPKMRVQWKHSLEVAW